MKHYYPSLKKSILFSGKAFLPNLVLVFTLCSLQAFSQLHSAKISKSVANARLAPTVTKQSSVNAPGFPCDGKIYFFRNFNGANWLSYIDQYTTSTPVVENVCQLTVTRQNAMGANPIDHYIYFFADPNTLYRMDAACNLTTVCPGIPTTAIGCFDYLGRYWIVTNTSQLIAYDLTTCSVVKGPYTLSTIPGIDIVFSSADCHFYMGDNNNIISIDTNGVIDSNYPSGFGGSGSIGGIAIGVDGNIYAIPNSSETATLYKFDVNTHIGSPVYTFNEGTANPCGCDMASFPCPSLTASFTASNNGKGCANTAGIQFTNNSSGLVDKWLWDFGDGSVDSTTFNPNHIYTDDGPYKVKLKVSALTKCLYVPPDSTTLDVQIYPAAATPSITGESSICKGVFTTLTASESAAYLWDNKSTSSSITVSPPSTVTYTLTITDINGCTASTTAEVTVRQSLDVDAGSYAEICKGDSTQLNATVAGAVIFTWSNPETLSDPASLSPYAKPSSTTTYTLSVADPIGCTGSDTVTVKVNDFPEVSFAPFASPVCESDAPFVLTGGSPAGGFYNGPGVNNNMFDPSIGAGTYMIIYSYQDVHSCSGHDSTEITVEPAGDALILPVADLCAQAAPVTLFAVPEGGTFEGPGIVGNTFYPSIGAGVYIITYNYTNSGTCISGTSVQTTITVTDGPVVTIAAFSTTGCRENTIYLGFGPQSVTLTASSSSNIVSYQWLLNGDSIPGATRSTFEATAAGSYNVIVKDANGCISDPANTVSFTIQVVDVRCGHDLKKVQLCHVPPGNSGNTQSLCIAPEAVPAHLKNHPGDCVGPCTTSGRMMKDIDEPANKALAHIPFEIYPNPFTNETSVEFTSPGGNVILELFDVKGQLVKKLFEGETAAGTQYLVKVDGTMLAEGIYTGSLRTQEGVIHRKLILAK